MKNPSYMTDEEIKYAMSDILTTIAVNPVWTVIDRYREDARALEEEQNRRAKKRIYRAMRREYVLDPLAMPARARRNGHWRYCNSAYGQDRLRTANFSLGWMRLYPQL